MARITTTNKELVGVILQPGYLPWLGFFDMMSKADIFIIYDDVQFTRRDWRTRNNIKLDGQKHLLSVPVKIAGHQREELMINRVEIDYSAAWQKKHIETIRQAYRKTPFFSAYSERLFELLSQKTKLLLDLQMPIINWANEILGLKTKIVFSSKIPITEGLKKSDRLIALCQACDVKHYLSGNAAKDYLDEKKFTDAGIRVYWHDYQHPNYSQIGQEFMPYLSVIDLIFNLGPEANKLFRNRLNLKS